MKHTNTATSLHWCRTALAAVLSLAGAAPAFALDGPPGELDPTFGSTGKLTTDFFNATDEIFAVAPLPDGRFLAAGSTIGPNASGPGSSPNVAVARYLPDGRLDTTFATNGKFQFDLGGGTDTAYSLKVLPDGSVLVGGELSPQSHLDFALLKLRPNGTLDTTFGADNGAARTGYVRLDIVGPTSHDEGRFVAVQRDGKIVLAGNSLVTQGSFRYRRATVARFTADGRIDTTFGSTGTGYVVLPGMYSADPQNNDYVTGIVLTQSGSLPANDTIAVTGYTFARNNGFIARLTRDGAIDTTFGDASGAARSGRVIVTEVIGTPRRGLPEVMGARMDDAGRIVVAGTGGDRGFAFLRYLADGTPDGTFGTNGRTLVKFSGASDYDEALAVALQGNGKIVAVGRVDVVPPGGTAQDDFFVVRLLPNGQPDPGFGSGFGYKIVSFTTEADTAATIAVEPSGNLLVGGVAKRVGAAQTDFAIARLFGDPDRLFYNGFETPVF